MAFIWWDTTRDHRLEQTVGEQGTVIQDHDQRLDAHDVGLEQETRRNEDQGKRLETLEELTKVLDGRITELRGRHEKLGQELEELSKLRDRIRFLEGRQDLDTTELEALRNAVKELETRRKQTDQRLKRIEDRLGINDGS